MAETAQRLFFNLADSLPAYTELPTYFLQGATPAVAKSKPEPQHSFGFGGNGRGTLY
jgi:hypothetical protein